MKRNEAQAIVLGLRERPDVWRIVYTAPLDLRTARLSGSIARALAFHGLPYPEHVEARSETVNGRYARVWAVFRAAPDGWQHKQGLSGSRALPRVSCSHCGFPRPEVLSAPLDT